MIPLIFILMVTLVYMVKTTRRPLNFPKGPPMLPVIGNLLHIDLANPNSSITALNRKYGDVGVIIPGFQLIFLKSPELIKELFENDKIVSRVDVPFNRDRFHGKNLGIIFIDGQMMTANKRFTTTTFRNFGMGKKLQEYIILSETEHLLSKIQQYDGEAFDIEPLLELANLNITWTILGGERIVDTDPDLMELATALKNIVQRFSILGGATVLLPFLRHLFPVQTGYNIYMEESRIIVKYIKKSLEYHRKTREPENPRDFIDAYLDQMESESEASQSYFSEDEMTAIVFDATAAGTGTTSTLLTFSILYLAIHQDVQEKLFEEVSSKVGLSHLPGAEDQIKLPYCQAVALEVLRLKPSVPVAMPHRAQEATKIGNYDIPKNTLIFAHFEESFLDPMTWPEPEKFKPERFLNDEGNLTIPPTFLPFSKGKRRCIGEVQAKLSSTLMLSALIQKFHFKLPPGVTNQTTEGTRKFLMAPPSFQIVAALRKKNNNGFFQS